MLKKIFLVIAIISIGFLLVASMRPNTFSYSRSTTISAPRAVVFPYLNDLKKGETWSPWIGIDPNMKITYDGPAAGVGASYHWVGNNQVGEGRSTIVESKTDELVKMKLEFIKPFSGTNEVEYTLASEGQQTIVTWTMSGQANFIGKVMGLLMNCEKMMNSQFDKGLAKLKSVVETVK